MYKAQKKRVIFKEYQFGFCVFSEKDMAVQLYYFKKLPHSNKLPWEAYLQSTYCCLLDRFSNQLRLER